MGEMTVNDALRMALEFHKQGNIAAAEDIYVQVTRPPEEEEEEA